MYKRELKQAILETSYGVMAKQGVSAIRMRDLAKACNCAVGTIYNVFSTFEEIHFHLNLRTFTSLIERLISALKRSIAQKLSIEELLPKIGWEYITFAKEDTYAWKALFEQAPVSEPPDWYIQKIDHYIQIVQDLLIINFQVSEGEANRLINYFWFAIHGVSSIVLNKKATNHSEEFVQSYVDHCLRGIYKLI